MNTNELLLTPREVDQFFRSPRGRAAKLAIAGQLPAIFLPDGEVRFNRQDISEALVKMSNRPTEGEQALKRRTRKTTRRRQDALEQHRD